MNKKRIAFIVSAPITAKAFLINHFKVLSNYFDITLIANFETENDFEIPYVLEKKKIEIYRKINISKDISALLDLYKYLKKENFDAIHTITPKAGLLGIISARLARVPIRIHIFTGQVWHTSKGIKKFFLKILDKILVFFATEIVIDGYPQKKFLEQNGIVKKYKSQVLGKGSISGVDLDRFKKSIIIRSEIRKKLGIDDNEFVFCFLGRLNFDKGIDELIKSFKNINNEFNKTKLLLIGFDEENYVEKIHENKNIIFTGPTNQPEILLQAGDVFCLPSHREAFGLSVLEASSLEIPIICSDTYGLSDSIIDGITGVHHKVGNQLDLEERMQFIYKNKEVREKMGKEGRKYVVENFSSAEISDAWLNFYLKILK